eukprot:1150069-Pelagomonas_calceolata.AAC.4
MNDAASCLASSADALDSSSGPSRAASDPSGLRRTSVGTLQPAARQGSNVVGHCRAASVPSGLCHGIVVTMLPLARTRKD